MARAQAIWARTEPRKIPSVKAILAGKNTKPQRSDMQANARAWITAIKAMGKGGANE